VSDSGPCGCEQAVELQAELDRARVRISNLEYQNSNLRGRLDAASPPLPPTTPPPPPASDEDDPPDPTCWHCGCALIPFKHHCFDCPSECDGCDRCEWRRTGAAHTPGGGQLPDEGGPAPGGAGTTRPGAEPVACEVPSSGADFAAYLQAERDRSGLLRRLWAALKAVGD